MRIEYLVDYADLLETLARWHHGEWSHLNPGDTLEKRVVRMREHLGRRQIPTTFIALDGETLLEAGLPTAVLKVTRTHVDTCARLSPRPPSATGR